MQLLTLRRGWSWPPDNGQKKQICSCMLHLIDRGKDKEDKSVSCNHQKSINNYFKSSVSPSRKAVATSIKDTLKTLRIPCLQRCKKLRDVVSTNIQCELKNYLQNLDEDGMAQMKNILHLCGLDNSKRIKQDSYEQKENQCCNTLPTALKNVFGFACFPHFQRLSCYPVYERSLEHYFSDNDRTISSSSNMMSYEWIRLESFKTFPQQVTVRPLRLAQAGFYYLGTDDKVCCYSCGKCYGRWTDIDDPLEIHRQISPLCSHINDGDSQNCPITYAEDAVATIHQQGSEQNENSTVLTVQRTQVVSSNHSLEHQDRSANCTSGVRGLQLQQSSVSIHEPQTPVSTHAPQSSVSTQISQSFVSTQLPFSSVSAQLPHSSVSTQSSHSSVSAQLPHSSVSTQSSHSSVSAQLPHSSVSTQSSHSSVSTQLPQTTTSTQSSVSTQLSLQRMQTSTNPLGINFEKPRYPSFSVASIRIDTFSKWPSNLTQSPRDMAAAGFFYAGYADYVRCFFCGGGLRSWDPYDDPWTEHARWFPRCVFLHQNKGNTFVTSVHQRQEQFENGYSEMTTLTTRNEHATKPVRGESNDDVISNAAIQSVIEMGYPLNTVENTIKVLRARKGNVTIKAVDILDIIFDLEDKKDEKYCDLPSASTGESVESITETLECTSLQEETHSLVEENRRLKEQRLCKICLDQDANIAFLPCGHLCCCAECAPAMRKCPICRTFVKGTVKTWLS